MPRSWVLRARARPVSQLSAWQIPGRLLPYQGVGSRSATRSETSCRSSSHGKWLAHHLNLWHPWKGTVHRSHEGAAANRDVDLPSFSEVWCHWMMRCCFLALLCSNKHILNQTAKFVLIMHVLRNVFVIRAGPLDKVIRKGDSLKNLKSELVKLSKSWFGASIKEGEQLLHQLRCPTDLLLARAELHKVQPVTSCIQLHRACQAHLSRGVWCHRKTHGKLAACNWAIYQQDSLVSWSKHERLCISHKCV